MKRIGRTMLEVLKCTWEYEQRYGSPPTVRELCKILNRSSPSTIHQAIQRCVLQGLLVPARRATRRYEISQYGMVVLNVSLVDHAVGQVLRVTHGDPRYLPAVINKLREIFTEVADEQRNSSSPREPIPSVEAAAPEAAEDQGFLRRMP